MTEFERFMNSTTEADSPLVVEVHVRRGGNQIGTVTLIGNKNLTPEQYEAFWKESPALLNDALVSGR